MGMVRNVASTRSLRGDLSELRVGEVSINTNSSQQCFTERPELPPMLSQTEPPSSVQAPDLDRFRPSVPLLGYQEAIALLTNGTSMSQMTEGNQHSAHGESGRKTGISHPPIRWQSAIPSAPCMAELHAASFASEAGAFRTVARGSQEPGDFQRQLMLLEQENKRRLVEARAHDESESTAAARQCRKDTAINRRKVLVQYDKDNLTPSDPLLAKSTDEWTTNDYMHFEQLWKKHMCEQAAQRYEKRKSSGSIPDASEEASRLRQATRSNASKYTKPFCDFLTNNPTVFHAVAALKEQMKDAGWTELSEREEWSIKPNGSYYVERNGSALVAFTVGGKYEPGNGAALLAGHVDALTAKLKPISQVPNKAGYLQLGVAPYAGAPNQTWWDRDLGIGGRVLIEEGGKIVTKLVKLDYPIARIPTLAPHFGAAAVGPFNPETRMVPIIGLDNINTHHSAFPAAEPFSNPPLLGGINGPVGNFVSTQPPRLVKAIGDALGLNATSYGNMVNWELELFDVQPATTGGLDREFIYAGRIDDKLCSWAAMQALLASQAHSTRDSGIIKAVALFDDEEIGSLLRQGARSNFLPLVLERAVGSLAGHNPTSDLMGRTYANSFLVSSDVTHAVNPNFLDAYLENHAPHLNVGVAVCGDSNGHMTTDAVSTAILKRCADKVGATLQVFQIRNDSRSGGTVGPMLSAMTGIRAVDAGIPQLSMHSIRATTGALDPGLGVLMFGGFLDGFQSADREFRA